jgi:WW domain-binding protein 2
LKPVTGGGIPAVHAYVEIKLTFKDGGAFDFHSCFERIRDQQAQALEVARDSGRDVRDALGDVHGEDLPAYEEPSRPAANNNNSSGVSDTVAASFQPPPGPPPSQVQSQESHAQPLPPNEDPPGYEEVQSNSVMNNLEESVRQQSA